MLRIKRLRYACFLITLLCLLGMQITASWAAEEPPAAKESRSQIIRVWLTRLGLTNRMDVTLDCPYSLTADSGARMLFPRGSQIAFLQKNKTIYLYYEGLSLEVGGGCTLARVYSDGQEATGFYRTNYPELYLGDLRLDIEGDALRPILSIHVEDYLLGVVPYEMSNSFPLEALKAQAVAARTYALRKQNRDKPYDVVDTTNDQVFRGYLPGNANVEKAVLETRGVCGFYQGALAQCYYAASNGGQMERVHTVWPTNADFSYYAYGEDPYDVANPFSIVQRFRLKKKPVEEAPYALRAYLAEALTDVLSSAGFGTTAECLRIDEVVNAFVDTPAEEGSLRMTMLHLTLRLSGRTRSVVIPMVDGDTEEVSLFLVDEPTGVPTETPRPTEKPEPKTVYGAFQALEKEIDITIPIFPTAEKIFDMNISSNAENEIWRVSETRDTFTLEARRFGHGVGMSQRGAQWMALKHGKSYQEILAFYYPGMKLMQYPKETAPLETPDEMLSLTPGPAPSPTPKPTPIPLTLTPGKGERLAEVTEISSGSSLNLRMEPNLNAEIAMRLYKGQKLIVVRSCQEAGWVEVRLDGASGYVVEQYLTYERD